MAVFFDNSITDVGRQLWAEMQAGGSFTPTRIVIGSGYMPASKTSRTMTAVAEPVQSIELNKAQAQPDGDYIFGGAFSNKDVAQAFYYRELALYAKVKRADGTETAEILYSYGNAGENAELIPAYGAGTVVEKQLDLLVYIGNDAEVTVNISTGVYVDREEFNAAVDKMLPKTGGDINGHLGVSGGMSAGEAIYAKTFAQLAAYYDMPIEIGQYIDLHLPGGNADVDGRISIGEDKTLFYNYKPVWLSHAIASGSVNDLDDGVWEVGENVTDKPTVQACIIIHKRWNDGFKAQLAMSYAGSQHFRTMVQGSWGEWQQIFTTGNPPTTAGGVYPATVE